MHDLKHTFRRRLRAAGVSYEDRQDLLGHRSGRITTHFSMAELSSLLASANRFCEPSLRRSPTLFVLNRAKSASVIHLMARPERLELPTTWFEARYSIQLSYRR